MFSSEYDSVDFVNFSEELFGEKNAISDEDVRRVPSVLSLFSEKSEKSEASHIAATQVPSPTNYPALFASPKHILSTSSYNLTAVLEGNGAGEGSERSIQTSVMERTPSLGSMRGQTFNDSLIKLGVQIIDDNDFDYVSDEEDGDAAAPTPAPAPFATIEPQVLDTITAADQSAHDPLISTANPLHMTTSFVQSMSEYAFRRELIMARIKDGALVTKLTPSKEGAVDKRQQVNLEFYSDEVRASQSLLLSSTFPSSNANSRCRIRPGGGTSRSTLSSWRL